MSEATGQIKLGRNIMAATESAPKKNGTSKPPAPTTSKPEPEKTKAPKIHSAENNVWALCRDLLEGGKKPEDIKKQAQVFLMKHTDPQAALKAWTSRLAARAVWRAQRAAKAGKGK